MDDRRKASLEETRRFWQGSTSRVLTEEDARQTVENVVGFFTTLAGWSSAAQSNNSMTETEAA